MPVNPQPPVYTVPSTVYPTQSRKVGILLGIGILFIPHIFSWFTLRKGHSNLARTVSFVWLGILLLMTGLPSNRDSTKSGAQSATASFADAGMNSRATESAKETALRLVSIDFNWSKGGFGSVMIVDFVILNPSNYAIKDLEVTCTHFANSGTRIDSNSRTIYEVVPAKGKKIVKDFNMGFIHSQATKTSCKVLDLEVAN